MQGRRKELQMRYFNLALIILVSTILGILVEPTAWAQEAQSQTPQTTACQPGPFWVVFWVVTILLFVFLMVMFIGLLRNKDWSLADAVSEEAAPQPPTLPEKREGKPIMVASSSRLVALLGLLGILSMFIGVGYYLLWVLFCTGTVPQLWEIVRFFYTGAAMFAPYIVNQIRETFESFAPKQG
jgi:hypothetical protein